MSSFLEKIESAFRKKNIRLKERITEANCCSFAESVTNEFLKVEDELGNHYLVRINGKLWPPFTRENEDHNLKRLDANSLVTHVIENNVQNGFQISHLHDRSLQFAAQQCERNKQQQLQTLASEIKKYHQIGGFRNKYPVGSTLLSSYNRLAKHQQLEFETYQELSLRIFLALSNDRSNFVSSHNDLLPTSVYFKNEQAFFVDWEYSGENHRSFDLVLFSLKSALTLQEENTLISHYDPSNELDMQYAMSIMKPVVHFLLLLWRMAPAQRNQTNIPHGMLRSVNDTFQNALVAQSAKALTRTRDLSFFKVNIHTCSEQNIEKQAQSFHRLY